MAAPTGFTAVSWITINPVRVPSAMITPSGAPTLRISPGQHGMVTSRVIVGVGRSADRAAAARPSLSSVYPVE